MSLLRSLFTNTALAQSTTSGVRIQSTILATQRLATLSRQLSTSSQSMAPVQKECDYLVIGGGSGGLASGRRASGMYGAKVIAIEGKRLGGTCVNVGCVPKKIIWTAADLAERIRHDAKPYGFSIDETAPFDWSTFKQKRDAYIKRLNGIYEKNLNNDKVEHIHGWATIKDKETVEVKLDDGSKETIKTKKILIAVGGHPSKPSNIEGHELGLDSDGFFDIAKQPKKVAIVGAGYIAVEFAGMFNALGTETHLFIRQDSFLRSFDPMIQKRIVSEYERQGVIIHKQSSQSKVEKIGDDQRRLHYKDQNGEGTLDVDHVIWAIGRAPETEGLGLEKLGVEVNEKGHIKVDKYQNTNVENVYAIGDVCNQGFELTPVAIAAGRRLADRLYGGLNDAHLVYDNIPSVVFAHPEVGSIGLSEPAAREKYGDKDVKIYESNFVDMYYAMMEQDAKTQTSYKIVCAGPNETVVGLHIVGKSSAEILQGFGVAIKMGATKADFDRCVAIHPTAAEELVTMK